MRTPTHPLHLPAVKAAAVLLALATAPVLAAPAQDAPSARAAAAEDRDEALIRVAQAQQPPPLVVGGPVRAAAGSSTSFPVSLRPGATDGGRYVVVMKAPAWLSFSNGEQVGNGIWLLERDKLAKVEMKIAANAAGSHDLSVGLGGKTGGIQGISDLRVEVGAAAAATPPPAVVAQAPAPKPAAPPAAAKPPAGGVTWESLVGGKKPPAPAPAAATAQPAAKPAGGTKTDAQLIQEAKHLVRECTTCHNLYGQDVGIPVMVGLTVDRFLDTMDLYKRDKRDNKIMQVISKSLSDEETRALALYLSRIKPAVQTEAAASLGGGSIVDPAKQAQEPIALAVKTIDDDKTRARVVRWLQRGEQMLNDGDIAQARLLLERATEFGDARAAFLMATSFDPNALPWRSNVGMVAEPLQARRWYLTAKTLGAGAEADQRLAELPAPR